MKRGILWSLMYNTRTEPLKNGTQESDNSLIKCGNPFYNALLWKNRKRGRRWKMLSLTNYILGIWKKKNPNNFRKYRKSNFTAFWKLILFQDTKTLFVTCIKEYIQKVRTLRLLDWKKKWRIWFIWLGFHLFGVLLSRF